MISYLLDSQQGKNQHKFHNNNGQGPTEPALRKHSSPENDKQQGIQKELGRKCDRCLRYLLYLWVSGQQREKAKAAQGRAFVISSSL